MMNERITELWIAATDYAKGLPEPISHNKREDAQRTKFAELIVKECASIDFYKLAHIGTEDDFNVTRVIKEHFGVE
jgi:hypothetical protein